MNETQTVGKLAGALAKAQMKMEVARKDSTNPHLKSKYADIASVIAASRILSEHEIAITQFHIEENDRTYLVTQLIHSSGEKIEGRIRLINPRNDMPGLVAATTYARRCALCAICGIAPDDVDDDGHTAVGGYQNSRQNYPDPTLSVAPTRKPSRDQIKRLFAMGHSAGLDNESIHQLLIDDYSLKSSSELDINQYNEFCNKLESYAKELVK